MVILSHERGVNLTNDVPEHEQVATIEIKLEGSMFNSLEHDEESTRGCHLDSNIGLSSYKSMSGQPDLLSPSAQVKEKLRKRFIKLERLRLH